MLSVNYLTIKLKRNSLNEESQSEYFEIKSDIDSGTESDEELNKSCQHLQNRMDMSSHDSESFRERFTRERTRSSSGKENAPIIPVRGRQTRRERKSECEMLDCESSEKTRVRDRSESPLDMGADFALPSDSDLNWGDQHSSEEELEVINSQPVNEFRPVRLETRSAGPMRSRDQQGEKRKWSQFLQVTRFRDVPDRLSRFRSGSALGVLISDGVNNGISSDDDDMIPCTRLTPVPVQFRTSPPEDAHRPFRSQSPPNKLFHAEAVQNGTSDHGVGLTPKDVVSIGGAQKKQRKGLRPQFLQRPYLDFEKMQELKAHSMTAWQHDGELSLFCW
ncbi:uncharacterized protein LOC136029979 isoform X3 [Artemia franciscana]|uniref:uncharacterized protein LOC136029979 isoform X3 n=2 Tax=Artemia franciscana TaxID=6661 RepID=UPI0032DA15E0